MKNLRYSLLALLPIILLVAGCPFLNLWSEKREAAHTATPKATAPLAQAASHSRGRRVVDQLQERHRQAASCC